MTSRWTTPRAWAWAERLAEHRADPQELAVADPPAGEQLRQARAADRLGDQVVGVLVGAGLIQCDDRRVAEAGRGDRLALGPSALLAPVVGAALDPLDRDLALELLVVREPDRPERAGAEPLEQRVAVEHELARIGLH